MFRWGILSTAKIAREHVIPAIAGSRNGTLSAIASREPDRARSLARRFGIAHVFDSYEELLTSSLIDGVYIPLPTSQHVEWTAKALRADKHVLVEKPLAMEAREIDALVALREVGGRLVSEAFMVTYHPQWLKVRELVRSGAIGRLLQVQGAFTNHNVDPADMRNQMALGGGGVRDIGVYPLVTTRFVTGREPERVHAIVERDPSFLTDRYASVRADFGDFELSFYIATQAASRQIMIFHGDSGYIELAAPFNGSLYDDQRFTLFDRDHREARTIRFPAVDQYQLEVEAFADAVLSGQPDRIFSLEDSIANQRAIDAIFRSATHQGWETVA